MSQRHVGNKELTFDLQGYEVFMPSIHDYDTGSHPKSWAKIMAVRHAITKYPDASYIWFLDQNALIMNPKRSVEEQLLYPRVLESLMIRDYPIVPPDSIIKTFAHLRGEDADLIISQDNDGLISDSMILKNGDWAKFLTETWLDPLYRSYNFQKAQRHALVSLALGSKGVGRHRWLIFASCSRSTLYNGTPRSSPRLPSSRSGRWPPTRAATSGQVTRTATSWPCSQAARRAATSTAKTRQCRTTRSGRSWLGRCHEQRGMTCR